MCKLSHIKPQDFIYVLKGGRAVKQRTAERWNVGFQGIGKASREIGEQAAHTNTCDSDHGVCPAGSLDIWLACADCFLYVRAFPLQAKGTAKVPLTTTHHTLNNWRRPYLKNIIIFQLDVLQIDPQIWPHRKSKSTTQQIPCCLHRHSSTSSCSSAACSTP